MLLKLYLTWRAFFDEVALDIVYHSIIITVILIVVISCVWVACHVLVECRCIAKDDPLIKTCDGAVFVIKEEGWYDFTNIAHPDCYGSQHTTIRVANDSEGTGKVIDMFSWDLGGGLRYDITPERMYVSNGWKLLYCAIPSLHT